MFDLNTKQLNDTTIFQLNDPSGDPLWADEEMTLPVQLEIFGKSSKQYRQWQASAARKNLANKNKVPTQEQIADNTAEFLTAVTKTSYNLAINGEAILTADQFKEVYLNPALMWVGDQVAEKLGDMSGFLQK